MANRRNFVLASLSLVAVGTLGKAISYAHPQKQHKDENMTVNIDWKNIKKSEWKTRLTAQEFHVMRKEGTERPFTSSHNKEKRAGTFTCAGCGLPLFEASTKYESGTGWPSFWKPIAGNIETKRDFKMVIRAQNIIARGAVLTKATSLKTGPSLQAYAIAITVSPLILNRLKA